MDRISYTNKGTIPSGLPYSNINPSYTLTREFEDTLDPSEMDVELRDMKDYIDGKIKSDFDMYMDFMKQKGCEDHRFTEIEGVKTPHVTNIITPDRPAIPHIEEHAILGTGLDTATKKFIDTGEWTVPQIEPTPNVKVTIDELVMLMSEWFEKNPLVRMTNHSIYVHNKEFCYCGELDSLGFIGEDSCIFDVKKTKVITKELYSKYFQQMAAYAKCLEVEPDLMCIVSPYNEPIIEANVERYFNKFLINRGRYRERFNI